MVNWCFHNEVSCWFYSGDDGIDMSHLPIDAHYLG